VPGRSLLVLLAALAGLAPTALPGQKVEETYSDAHGVRQCREARLPKKLPDASMVVDTAQVMAMLREQPVEALASVAFGEDGGIMHLAILGSEGAADSTSGVARWLRTQMRLQAPGQPWAVRLRLIGGDAPLVRTERSVFCPAARRLEPGGRERKGVVVSGVDPRSMRPPRTPVIEVVIGSDGIVRRADLLQSSDYPEIDRQVIADAGGWLFRPALIDGVPVPTWFRTNRQQQEY